MSEHAVIVRFEYGLKNLDPLFALEEELESLISAAGTGEYDGNEVAVNGSHGTLYMYGPDADALYASVREALRASQCINNAEATLRYGPPEDGVREVVVRVAA